MLLHDFFMVALEAGGVSTVDLSSIITADTLSGLFDQIVAMLPIVIPVTLGFLGIRKAISFVMGMIQSA